MRQIRLLTRLAGVAAIQLRTLTPGLTCFYSVRVFLFPSLLVI